MICRLMFTMCACRIFRRFTTSVICMRVRNSFRCACTAKIETWLVSKSCKNLRRQIRQRTLRQILQHPDAIGRAQFVKFMHDRRRDLERGFIGDHANFFLWLHPQAHLHGIARAGSVFRIKGNVIRAGAPSFLAFFARGWRF